MAAFLHSAHSGCELSLARITHTAYTQKHHKCGCKPWKCVHRNACLPFFPVLVTVPKPSMPTSALNNFRCKPPWRCSSLAGIYFKGPVSVNASAGRNASLLPDDEQHFSTEILGLEDGTGARISFHLHHITKWCSGYIYGLISAG